jgi:hypothetical protein
MKIAEILEYLSKEYGINTVNLEGGSKDYDLSVFTKISDARDRDRVSDHFVSEGMVSGAEYFAINNPDKVNLWGIEDPALYKKNLDAYIASNSHKEQIEKHLKSLSYILTNLKLRIYSKDLLDFDTRYSQYKADNLPFKDYLDYLVSRSKAARIAFDSYTNILLLSKVMADESKIDFKAANKQRDELIDRLQKKLPKIVMDELVVKTVEFKADRISHKDYYAYIADMARSVGLDMAQYANLQRYISYISIYASIDKMKVMAELENLEDAIRSSLCKTAQEKDLALLSKNLAIMRNLFNVSITRQDYEYYKHNIDAFGIKEFVNFINKTGPLYKIDARPDADIAIIDDLRVEMARFYEISFQRDEAFLKNLRFAQYPLPNTQYKPRASVIITGGFHTENLRDLFARKGVSYISILPNFTSSEGCHDKYSALLCGKRSPVEETIVAFLPKSLAVASYLNSLGDEVRGQHRQIMLKILTSLELNKGVQLIYMDNLGKEHRLALDVNGKPVSDSAEGVETISINDLVGNIGISDEASPVVSTPSITSQMNGAPAIKESGLMAQRAKALKVSIPIMQAEVERLTEGYKQAVSFRPYQDSDYGLIERADDNELAKRDFVSRRDIFLKNSNQFLYIAESKNGIEGVVSFTVGAMGMGITGLVVKTENRYGYKDRQLAGVGKLLLAAVIMIGNESIGLLVITFGDTRVYLVFKPIRVQHFIHVT